MNKLKLGDRAWVIRKHRVYGVEIRSMIIGGRTHYNFSGDIVGGCDSSDIFSTKKDALIENIARLEKTLHAARYDLAELEESK